jgi:hypothetical protein
MRNRAKCKLCETIIESFNEHDFISCKCGEIAVDGGQSYYKASFINPENFLRVDDEGSEIVIQFKDNEEGNAKVISKPSRKELLDMLDEMTKRIEELPPHATLAPVTHADFASLLMLLSSIFRSDCNEAN